MGDAILGASASGTYLPFIFLILCDSELEHSTVCTSMKPFPVESSEQTSINCVRKNLGLRGKIRKQTDDINQLAIVSPL